LNEGEVSVAIEAVTDTTGARHVMLSLPGDERVAVAGPIAALREPLDESRAIVWVKDLEGRYVYVNRRFTTDLGTSEERLRGHRDDELPKRETVDGPRERNAADGVEEPLQLEYIVPAFEGRPQLVALRFVTRDPEGQPMGVCGVAAPWAEAQLAREEAARLMRIERRARLDAAGVRAELLEEWGVAPEATGGAVEQAWGETATEPDAGRSDEIADDARTGAEDAQADTLSWDPPVPATTETRDAEPEPAHPEPEPAHPEPEPAHPEPEPAPRPADSGQELERQLERAHADVEQARREAEAARADLEAARREREQAREEREQAREEREQARIEVDRSRTLVAEARSEAIVAQGQAEVARIQLGLDEDLQRALAAERERSDELARTLAQVRTRVVDLERAFEGGDRVGPRTD
jgi:hypothetical protein